MTGTTQRATLATVAAASGVSVATVSKVLNGRLDDAPETRARVQQMLRVHDYGSHLVAIERQPVVELAFQGRIGTYSAEVLSGVAATAAELGVSVTVSVTESRRHGRQRSAQQWARDLASKGRTAVIAVTDDVGRAEAAALARVHLPLVVIDPMNMPAPGTTSVGSTNFRGGMAAGQHLLDLGHRRLGYLGGFAAAECSQARLQGFKAALETQGLRLPDRYVVNTGDFMYEDGLTGAPALLDLPERPSAVFATSDELARGLIEAARSRGIRVPHDLSVVGFDDTEIARIASPPLTTVRQPLGRMGAVALRTAVRLAAGERLDSNHVELATELVVRESSAPPSD